LLGLRALRLLRIVPALARLFDATSTGDVQRAMSGVLSTAAVYLAALVYTAAVLVNLLACLWFLVARSEGAFDAPPRDTWLDSILRDGVPLVQLPRAQIYVAAAYFSVTTLTTVGYGDKAPRSVVGRTVAIIWMLTSLILTASFTATITSALTVNTLNSAVKGPADLPRLHVGAVAGTSSIEYLDERRISYRLYPDATQGLQAVARGEIDTFIADKPLLQFRLGQLGDLPVQVMPHIFGRQDYSFAIPNGSSLRPEINKVLLRLLESPGWSQLRRRYLGDD
jgi:hypothetical protein